jgi:FSR family fosmidomycin resistance protein-like MFS transporter
MLAKLNMRTLPYTVFVLYGVELLDELIYGLVGATLPVIKSELVLSYTQIGLLTTVPGLIGIAVEPFFGVFGDTPLRRALVRGGLVATTFGLALAAFGQSYAMIMTAFAVMYVASGAYVDLAEATLMDQNPERTDQTMARWTLLGEIGVVVAPLLATFAFALGYGWRGLYLGFAGAAGVYVALIWRVKFNDHNGADHDEIAPRALFSALWQALRNRDLLRWILLTELADLMLDKLYEVTGLYFFDVVGVDLAQAAFAVSIFAAAGLVGSLLVIPALERVHGLALLRGSTFVVILLYSAFLLVPFAWAKYVLIGLVGLCTAGWYAILRGRTFAALPGQSGMVVAVSALANLSLIVTPTLLGAVADTLGLQIAMWILILGPIAMLLWLPRSSKRDTHAHA